MTSEALLWGMVIALLIAVGLLTLLVIGLLRSYADLVRTLHDAGIRTDEERQSVPRRQDLAVSNGPSARATPFGGETLDGGARSVAVTGAADMLLLAFLSSGCAACVDYWRTLRASRGTLPDLEASVVVVTKGPEHEEPGKLTELAGDQVTVVMSDEAWDGYDVPLTPHFVLVDRRTGKVVGEGSAPDPKALAGLMARAAADAQSVTRRELFTGKRETA